MRTFNAKNRDLLEERIGTLARGIATAMGGEVDFTYTRGYPATVNHPEMTELVREEAARVVGEEGVHEAPLMMGAEDFSYFLEEVPGRSGSLAARTRSAGWSGDTITRGSTWTRRRWRSAWSRWPMSLCATWSESRSRGRGVGRREVVGERGHRERVDFAAAATQHL